MHDLDHQWPLTNGDPWRRDVINAWRVVAARLRRGWAWATVLWAASSCAAPGTIAPDTGTAAAQLDTLYEAYFEQRLQRSPSAATFIGDHRFDDRLENSASPAYEAALKREQQHFLAQAQAINTATLTPAQRLRHDIFVGDRQLALERLSFPGRLLPIDQMGSMASTFALLGSGHSAQPFKTVADYRAFLARAEEFSLWVDSAIDAMREGVRTGVVNPRVIMLKVVTQLRDITRDPPEQSIFWQPIAALPTTIAAPQRQQLTESYRLAIVTIIVPAYRRLADFIERDYLPHTHTSVGMNALPNGQAWYRYQIRKQTTTELPADEIHALGLAEMARIRGEIKTVLQALYFQGSVQAFYRHVQNDARFFAQDAEQLLAGFRSLKQRIHAELPRLFKTMPRADYEIRPVESFRAASAAGGSYQSLSADGTRPGIFYVNTHNLRAQPLYSMATLALHEGVPGHHYQFAIQQELEHLPRFQRFNNFKAYGEGWALYCESLGHELGLYRDPMQWYGHLNDEMLRAMRLVVDTGLHAKNWSREQAITFMQSNSSMAASDLVAEVERYIAWPGQALSYKIGQLQISALRARAERALGTAFDVREFHAEVLRDGAVPMHILDTKVNHWIAERRAIVQREPLSPRLWRSCMANFRRAT